MKTFLFFLLLLPACLLHSQSPVWQQKQSLPPGAGRTLSTAFSIGGKIYVVGGNLGNTGLDDVWEYDIAGNAWVQKGNFPGGIRGGAVSFAIGGKGYFACGSNYTGQYFNDLWEYTPSSDTWIQRSNFGGMPREEAACFVIGSKGYVGTGYQEVVGPNSTFFITYKDLWEYDPSTNSWAQKALLPGLPRGWAVGGAIGSKGYIGLGSNSSQNASFNDFYEYDPTIDTWTTVASYSQPLGDAMCFSHGQELYVLGGINFGTGAGTAAMRKFNPNTNTWVAQPAYGSGVTMGGVAVTGANRVFAGTGYNTSFSEKGDWWELLTSTLCPAPLSFSTSAYTIPASSACNATVVLNNIMNGCAPYSVTVLPAAGTVVSTGTASTSFSVTGLCPGNYTFIINDNCCGPAQRTVAVDPSATGIAATESGMDLNVYPNPGKGRFYIASGNNQLLQNIQIVSFTGQQIGYRVELADGMYVIELDAPEKGVYLLRAQGSRGVVSKRLIVE